MGPSPGYWLAALRADLTLGKTAICIFVAKFYGRMPFLSPTQTLSAVQDLRMIALGSLPVDSRWEATVTQVVTR